MMALDVGDRRIGIALSDPTGLIATPHTAVDRLNAKPSEFDQIVDLAIANEVNCIVVGMPISLSGQFGQQANKVQEFISRLSGQTDIYIETVDERYSTLQAQRLLNESDRRPPRDRNRARGNLDAAAAAVILQAYLDSKR